MSGTEHTSITTAHTSFGFVTDVVVEDAGDPGFGSAGRYCDEHNIER